MNCVYEFGIHVSAPKSQLGWPNLSHSPILPPPVTAKSFRPDSDDV